MDWLCQSRRLYLSQCCSRSQGVNCMITSVPVKYLICCHYNAVNFHQNPHHRHPITRLRYGVSLVMFCCSHCSAACYIMISYTLHRENRVTWNRYSRLFFTSEDQLCTKLCVQEQSMNMTSLYQYLTFAWHHRSNVMMSQLLDRNDHPWRQWHNERSMTIFRGFCI